MLPEESREGTHSVYVPGVEKVMEWIQEQSYPLWLLDQVEFIPPLKEPVKGEGWVDLGWIWKKLLNVHGISKCETSRVVFQVRMTPKKKVELRFVPLILASTEEEPLMCQIIIMMDKWRINKDG